MCRGGKALRGGMASALTITIDMQAINQGNQSKQRGKERDVKVKCFGVVLPNTT